MSTPRSHRSWRLVALGLAVLYRLPALLNGGDVNSDAAVVGLQARHFAAGEWVWNLWGAKYQLAIEALLLTPLAGFLGRSPVLLLLPPLLGLLVMISLVWRLLARTLSPAAVFACMLPLVFGTHAILSPMVYVMRQVMVTCSIAGVAWLHFAATTNRSALWFFLGGAVFGSAAMVDAFALILFPAGAVLACGLAWVSSFGRRRTAVLRAVAALAGLGLVALIARSPGDDPFGWAFYKWLFGERHALLTNECLPFALGLKAYTQGNSAEWHHPAAMLPFVWLAVGLFVVLILSPLALVFVRRVDPFVRVLGLFGTTAGLTAVGAFVLRGENVWAVRYLAPLLWFAPFSLAPALSLLGARVGLPLVGLWAVVAGTAGWASWGAYVDGPAIVRIPRARLDDVHALRAELLRRGVHAAWSDYWQAYRLTLLFEEQVVVAPTSTDRYAPYRDAATAQQPQAFIFEAGDPRFGPDSTRAIAQQRGMFVEELSVGRYSVLLVSKPATP